MSLFEETETPPTFPLLNSRMFNESEASVPVTASRSALLLGCLHVFPITLLLLLLCLFVDSTESSGSRLGENAEGRPFIPESDSKSLISFLSTSSCLLYTITGTVNLFWIYQDASLLTPPPSGNTILSADAKYSNSAMCYSSLFFGICSRPIWSRGSRICLSGTASPTSGGSGASSCCTGALLV